MTTLNENKAAVAQSRVGEAEANLSVGLATIREALKKMNPDERIDFISEIMAGYCRNCGDEDPDHRCQCWNDE